MLNKILNTTLSKILIAIMGLAVMILNTRYLGAEKLGILSLILVAINLISQVSELVGGPAIVFLQRKYKTQQILLPAYLWALLVAIGGSLLFVLFQNHWQTHFILLLGITCLQNVNHAHLHILVGKRAFLMYNASTLLQISMLLGSLFYLYVFKTDISILAFLLAYSIGQMALFVLTLFSVWNHKGSTHLESATQIHVIKKLYQAGTMVQLSNVFQFGVYRLNYLILESLTSARFLGIYALGNQLAEKALIPVNAASLVQYSEVSNSSDKPRALEISINMLTLAQVLSFGAALALMLVPTELISYIFGAEFSESKNLFFVLGIGIFFLANSSVFSHYFSGLGKFHLNTLTSGIGLLVTVVLSYVFIPIYGMYGAALATSIVFAIQALIQVILFKRVAGIGWQDIYIHYKLSWASLPERVKSYFR